MSQKKYLFIGGSTKCGTTSAFNYFEFHPEICPCVMKESRYFWINEYPLAATSREEKKNNSFDDLFGDCSDNRIRIEATPDYLYSSASAKKIKSEITDTKFIFILRDPIDRLQSWFKFAKLNGLIEKTLLFEDYAKLQMEHPDPNRPQHMRSLEQGNYSLYLKQYIEIFGPENILITFYEDLAKDPLSFCQSICHFLKISSDYFTTYQFKIYNESVGKRHVGAHQLFRKLKRTIRPATRLFHDSLRKRLKLAGYTIEKMYTSANKDINENTFHINPDLMNQLRQYYAADISQMNQLLRKNLPWKTGSNQ